MATIVELECPAECIGFAETFERVPAFAFEIGGLIGAAPPLVWISADDKSALESALAADPTVEVQANLSTATAGDGQWLYRLDFGSDIKLLEQIVSENEGAILEASGRDGNWSLRLLFHDRSGLSEAHRLLGEYGFRFEVTRLTPVEEPSWGKTTLTKTQYEAVAAAHELGYFDVPRQVTLQELAAELDVSHQALSERLRRSHAALVSAELTNRMAPTRIDP